MGGNKQPSVQQLCQWWRLDEGQRSSSILAFILAFLDIFSYSPSFVIDLQNQRPNLESVINSGIRVFIFDGDADYICNYMGVEAVVRTSLFTLTRRYC